MKEKKVIHLARMDNRNGRKSWVVFDDNHTMVGGDRTSKKDQLKDWVKAYGSSFDIVVTYEGCFRRSELSAKIVDFRSTTERDYSYSCSSNNLWTSFDYGTVAAKTENEAMEKAKEALSSDLKVANQLLKGKFTIEMDFTQIIIEIKTEEK